MKTKVVLQLADDIKDSYADISEAKKFLGYDPKVSLIDGLGSLVKENTVQPKIGFD